MVLIGIVLAVFHCVGVAGEMRQICLMVMVGFGSCYVLLTLSSCGVDFERFH